MVRFTGNAAPDLTSAACTTAYTPGGRDGLTGRLLVIRARSIVHTRPVGGSLNRACDAAALAGSHAQLAASI